MLAAILSSESEGSPSSRLRLARHDAWHSELSLTVPIQLLRHRHRGCHGFRTVVCYVGLPGYRVHAGAVVVCANCRRRRQVNRPAAAPRSRQRPPGGQGDKIEKNHCHNGPARGSRAGSGQRDQRLVMFVLVTSITSNPGTFPGDLAQVI